MLIEAYMRGKTMPTFDFSDIREKGSPLITSGGKAPGPQPLKDCLHNLQKVLDCVENGAQLTPLQVHDMMCYIADAVLSGGIRRAALICLFNLDDAEMLTCKFGNWWELNPQRARANNSAVIVRNRVAEVDFKNLWDKMRASGSGEPGFYLTDDEDWGCNPCCEIGLRPFQFCNLVEINADDIGSQEDYEARAKAAAFLSTLQAGYTDFHYIREVWKRTTEKDALIGVSMTGIASGAILGLDEAAAAKVVLEENARVADLIGINSAARTTCIKPAGTTSCVLGSSSGIHAWHDRYFIRRMRIGKNESIYKYLKTHHPELVEDEFFKPHLEAVISLPIMAPEGAIFRDESALDLLERVKRFSKGWVKTGHREGANTHNVSATIYIKSDEWEKVWAWIWVNRDHFNGLSVLPHDGGSYKQSPFESCNQETYERMLYVLREIDLTSIVEYEDMTNLNGEAACAGGSCSLI
jgi:ribonucleoside-diphosphate reductase alpha chain